MKNYKFLSEYTVRPFGPTYKAGEVVPLSEASVAHFERKGLIEEVIAKQPVYTGNDEQDVSTPPRRGRRKKVE